PAISHLSPGSSVLPRSNSVSLPITSAWACAPVSSEPARWQRSPSGWLPFKSTASPIFVRKSIGNAKNKTTRASPQPSTQTRFFSAGQPIAANPEHEAFYPLTWLILLPSYDLGYRLHILVHIYIALVGMYALLRSMELRIEAALFGAISWGFGGLVMSWVNLLPILFCAAWLPLTCLFARRFLLRPNKRDFAIAALFLGLQFLVSEPTTVAQTGLLLGIYALYRAWYSHAR